MNGLAWLACRLADLLDRIGVAVCTVADHIRSRALRGEW